MSTMFLLCYVEHSDTEEYWSFGQMYVVTYLHVFFLLQFVKFYVTIFSIDLFTGTRLSLDALKRRLHIIKAYTNQEVQQEFPPFFVVWEHNSKFYCIAIDSETMMYHLCFSFPSLILYWRFQLLLSNQIQRRYNKPSTKEPRLFSPCPKISHNGSTRTFITDFSTR